MLASSGTASNSTDSCNRSRSDPAGAIYKQVLSLLFEESCTGERVNGYFQSS
jgi:hypothetical protein